jgi:hypothetical protein
MFALGARLGGLDGEPQLKHLVQEGFVVEAQGAALALGALELDEDARVRPARSRSLQKGP